MINHIKTMDLLKYLLISIPMISAMTCGIIFIIVFHKSLSATENRIRWTLGGYYLLMIFMWLLTNISLEHYKGRLFLVPVFFLLIHLTQVVFYHFICYILPSKEAFNRFHYKLTLVIFIMSIVLVYVLLSTKGYKDLDLYYFFYRYLYIYTSLTMIYYTSLCWVRLYQYNKEQFGFMFHANRLNWIHLLLVLRTIFSILFTFNNHKILFIDVAIILLIPLQHIVVTYNMLQKNIVNKLVSQYRTNVMLPSGQIVTVDNKGAIDNLPVESAYDNTYVESTSLLTQEDILSYFSTDKPYLNKNFKLDDLVKHFSINRTYISKFINVTFHTNVSQFINQWRLKEVDELLQAKPELGLEEIVLLAGFSNYRHYQRSKQIINQNKIDLNQ